MAEQTEKFGGEVKQEDKNKVANSITFATEKEKKYYGLARKAIDQYNQAADELEEAEKKIEELNGKLDSVSSSLNKMKSSKEEADKELDKYVKLYNKLAGDREKLEEEVKNKQDEIDSLSSRINEMSLSNGSVDDTLNDQIKELKQEKEELELTISNISKERDELQTTIDGLLYDKDILSSQLEERQKELTSCESELESLKAKYDELVKESANKEVAVSVVDDSVVDKLNGLIEGQFALKGRKVAVTKENAVEKLQELFNSLSSAVDSGAVNESLRIHYESILSKRTEEFSKISEENTRLKKDNDVLRASLATRNYIPR